MAEKITPRGVDYSQWYIDIVLNAKLADYSPVKGCMVVRPRGYAIWERIQAEMDRRFKETGHENVYFPMLIPMSFLKKEAEHVEGFAPELAVVTHGGGEELEEPLVIRPTSETIIWSKYKDWVHSWRDLPLLYNQWCSVLRWEKRTRLFLRTAEFLWQEGHTAHETEKEAVEETMRMLEVYRDVVERHLCLPVIAGRKSDAEKFAGAMATYSIEAMMQDKKALQAGTSHFLGQNFGKAFDVQFQSREGKLEYAWATSWGTSTRLIGAIVMTHSDDKGLVLPPSLAPEQAVIVPIIKNDTKAAVLAYGDKILAELKAAGIRAVMDTDDSQSPGWKFAEWEMRGVPLRIEIGPRDMEAGKAMVARRDTGRRRPSRSPASRSRRGSSWTRSRRTSTTGRGPSARRTRSPSPTGPSSWPSTARTAARMRARPARPAASPKGSGGANVYIILLNQDKSPKQARLARRLFQVCNYIFYRHSFRQRTEPV